MHTSDSNFISFDFHSYFYFLRTFYIIELIEMLNIIRIIIFINSRTLCNYAVFCYDSHDELKMKKRNP